MPWSGASGDLRPTLDHRWHWQRELRSAVISTNQRSLRYRSMASMPLMLAGRCFNKSNYLVGLQQLPCHKHRSDSAPKYCPFFNALCSECCQELVASVPKPHAVDPSPHTSLGARHILRLDQDDCVHILVGQFLLGQPEILVFFDPLTDNNRPHLGNAERRSCSRPAHGPLQPTSGGRQSCP